MTPSEDLSIAELTLYPSILIANIFVLIRHGLSRQAGWILLSSFCIIRIVGASFGVAYASTGSISDLEWSAILSSVGIGALLMSTAGLLQRVTDSICERLPREAEKPNSTFENVVRYIPIVGLLYRLLYVPQKTGLSHRSRLIQFTHLPSLVALIICIVGGTKQTSSNTSDQSEGKTMLKVGIIIFLVIYAILFAVAGYTALDFYKVPSGEKRILAAVLVALPLVIPRLLWSILAYFASIPTFNLITGSVVVRACMSTLEELLIIIMYTVVGLIVPPAYSREQGQKHVELEPQGKVGRHDVEMEMSPVAHGSS